MYIYIYTHISIYIYIYIYRYAYVCICAYILPEPFILNILGHGREPPRPQPCPIYLLSISASLDTEMKPRFIQNTTFQCKNLPD